MTTDPRPEDFHWFERLAVAEAAALARGEAAILPVGGGVQPELVLGLVAALDGYHQERLGRGDLLWAHGDGLLVGWPRATTPTGAN